MIRWIASLLGLSQLGAVLVVAVPLALVALGTGVMAWGAWKYHAGYSAGRDAGKALVEAAVLKATTIERVRQQTANFEASVEQALTIRTLHDQNSQLQSKLQDNADAASKDPRRDDTVFQSGSVRRLNSIGGGRAAPTPPARPVSRPALRGSGVHTR